MGCDRTRVIGQQLSHFVVGRLTEIEIPLPHR
jgi:hypothetical protein